MKEELWNMFWIAFGFAALFVFVVFLVVMLDAFVLKDPEAIKIFADLRTLFDGVR